MNATKNKTLKDSTDFSNAWVRHGTENFVSEATNSRYSTTVNSNECGDTNISDIIANGEYTNLFGALTIECRLVGYYGKVLISLVPNSHFTNNQINGKTKPTRLTDHGTASYRTNGKRNRSK